MDETKDKLTGLKRTVAIVTIITTLLVAITGAFFGFYDRFFKLSNYVREEPKYQQTDSPAPQPAIIPDTLKSNNPQKDVPEAEANSTNSIVEKNDTSKVINSELSQEKTALKSFSSPFERQVDFNGRWELKINADSIINHAGRVSKSRQRYFYVFDLKQTGQLLDGEIVQHNHDVFKTGDVTGEINGDILSLKINFTNIADAAASVKAKIISDRPRKISGRVDPISVSKYKSMFLGPVELIKK